MEGQRFREQKFCGICAHHGGAPRRPPLTWYVKNHDVLTTETLLNFHILLVKRSLAENVLTVVSIFVNPAQFAPHEDLATYPRTLPHDLDLLSGLEYQPVDAPGTPRTPSAVFVPSVKDMYPSGIDQDVSQQRGTFVEVKGYGEQMEGRSRPTFFRGVATIVTKLFNIIQVRTFFPQSALFCGPKNILNGPQPTNAYFGQKDIQQALLLRRLVGDLHLSHPTPSHLHIVPTARDPTDGLALSSRNAYLTPTERQRAPALYTALQGAARAWKAGTSKREAVQHALQVLEATKREGEEHGVEVRVDYIEMNDPDTFDVLGDEQVQQSDGAPVILSGAVWFGQTRLIDNLILGDGEGITAQ